MIQSRLVVGGERVDLKRVRMPLLNIYGKFDHLVPPEACDTLTSRVGSTDTEDICLNTGHIGIYVSSKCQQELAPKITSWLKQRDEQTTQKKRRAKQVSSTPTARRRSKTPKKPTAGNRHAKETADDAQ